MRLLCTVPCKKPVDVLFLLKAGEQIEDMKTFVKSYIKNADIGMHPKKIPFVPFICSIDIRATCAEFITLL